MTGIEWFVYEQSQGVDFSDYPHFENHSLDNPSLENHKQYNTKQYNTNIYKRAKKNLKNSIADSFTIDDLNNKIIN